MRLLVGHQVEACRPERSRRPAPRGRSRLASEPRVRARGTQSQPSAPRDRGRTGSTAQPRDGPLAVVASQSTAQLQSLAAQARRYPAMVFNNVLHLIDRDFWRAAYRRTRKDSAPGVDKVTAKQDAEHLDEHLRDLHERLRAKGYVAPPVERVGIAKEGGKKRPIRQPCFEDKMVQRAVVMILEAIFEPALQAFSHGFRRGHSAHQALAEVRAQCSTLHIN
jgi:hypothetical protein